MKKVMLAMCVCGLIGPVVPAEATLVSPVRSSKDTVIIDMMPDTNAGGGGALQVGRISIPNTGDVNLRSLVRFDLPFGAIGGDKVTSATLTPWFWLGSACQVDIYRLTHGWIEGIGDNVGGSPVNTGSGATWNSYNGPDNSNAPWPGGPGALGDVAMQGGSPKIFATMNVPAVSDPQGVPVSTDVTDLVKSWADGGPNNGMLLVCDQLSAPGPLPAQPPAFYSKDTTGYMHSGDPDVAPLLEIEWVPEPATLGLVALGALGLLRRRRS